MAGTTETLPSPETFTVHAPKGGWAVDPVGKACKVDEAVAAYEKSQHRRPAVVLLHDRWKVLAPHLNYNAEERGPHYKTLFDDRPEAVRFIDEAS